MKTLLSALLLTLALASPSAAQTPVQPGTTFAFDHDPAGAADTAFYQLCVDGTSDAACTITLGVVKGEGDTFTFTLPATVPRGVHTVAVRAVGFLSTGASGTTNTLQTRVVGKPTDPTLLRIQ